MTAIAPPPRHSAGPGASVYRRRRIATGTALLVLLGTGLYVPMTLLAPLGPAEVEVETPAPIRVDAADLDWPGFGAGAIGPVELPGVVEHKGSREALPLASISKIVTALTVLEKHPLSPDENGPTITMSATDASYYSRYLAQNGKVVPVAAGQRYSERDLLELALIESSNNHTTSLAVWAFGSEETFVAAAEAWLDAHSLDSIRIVEPTGIDRHNVGSTDDLLALGRLALADPLVAGLVASRREQAANVGAIENTNTLLGRDGVDGIKTGTLIGFGANLLFSADVMAGNEPVTLVGVVLGAPDHDRLNRGVRSLLATATDRLTQQSLVSEGDVLGRYLTEWGAEVELVAAEDASVLLWGDQEITAAVNTEAITTAPEGTRAGLLTFHVAEQAIDIPLVLAEPIEDPGPWWRLGHPGVIFGDP